MDPCKGFNVLLTKIAFCQYHQTLHNRVKSSYEQSTIVNYIPLTGKSPLVSQYKVVEQS